ncbi:MAG: PPOX class F420-dependent oxidoreductase [Acidimicrobiales bacterium]
MDIDSALRHFRDHRNAVLVTLRRDGRPQLSNVIQAVGDDGLIRISITGDRAKAANLRRDPRASLHVEQADHWAYAVIDGTVELSDEVDDPNGPTADAMVELYRSLAGEHEDWADYRAALVRDRRLMVTVHPTHAYGMWD